jgi:heme A synthase
MVAFFASGGSGFRIDLHRRRDQLTVAGLATIIVIGATGALNALADTLIQSDALRPAGPGEFLVTEPVLTRVRAIHPFVAIVGGLSLFMLVRYLSVAASRVVRRLALAIAGIVWLQFIVGLLNIALEVPLETQLLHLFVADVLWIAFVLLVADLLGGSDRSLAPGHDLPVSESV